MDWGVIVTAMPILIPYIVGKDRSFKEGFMTSALFSMGRFLVYFALGLVVFWVGLTLTEDAPSDFLRIAVALLGISVMIYGAIIVFRVSRPKWCPAKVAEKFNPAFTLILGLLIGSFFCPLLWAALVASALTRDFMTMVLSVVFFWSGSSITIFAAGTISGEIGGKSKKRIGKDKIKDVMGMVLMMAGAVYLVNGLL
jgi:sulfite exporter TauE/SafE